MWLFAIVSVIVVAVIKKSSKDSYEQERQQQANFTFSKNHPSFQWEAPVKAAPRSVVTLLIVLGVCIFFAAMMIGRHESARGGKTAADCVKRFLACAYGAWRSFGVLILIGEPLVIEAMTPGELVRSAAEINSARPAPANFEPQT